MKSFSQQLELRKGRGKGSCNRRCELCSTRTPKILLGPSRRSFLSSARCLVSVVLLTHILSAETARVQVSNTEGDPEQGIQLFDRDLQGDERPDEIACNRKNCCTDGFGFFDVFVGTKQTGDSVTLAVRCPEGTRKWELNTPFRGNGEVPPSGETLGVVISKPDLIRGFLNAGANAIEVATAFLNNPFSRETTSGAQQLTGARVVLAAYSPPSPAAQRPDSVNADDLRAAQDAYQKGIKFFRDLQYPQAAAALEKANERVESPEIYLMMGHLYSKLDLSQAAEHLQNGIRLVGRLESSVRPRFEAPFYYELARVRMEQQQFAAALRHARRSLLLNQERQAEASTTQFRAAVGRSHYLIASILHAQGRLDGALDAAQQAFRIHEDLGDEARRDVAADAELLGLIHRDKGNWGEAIRYMQQAQEIDADMDETFGLIEATSSNHLAYILALRGRKRDRDEARDLAERGLRTRLTYFEGPIHTRVAESRHTQAFVELKLGGALATAAILAQEALEVDGKAFPSGHERVTRDLELVNDINEEKVNRRKRRWKRAAAAAAVIGGVFCAFKCRGSSPPPQATVKVGGGPAGPPQ